VLGLMTIFDGSTILVFIKAHSAWPGHPLLVGVLSTGDGFGHLWGKKGEFCIAVGLATRTAGMQA